MPRTKVTVTFWLNDINEAFRVGFALARLIEADDVFPGGVEYEVDMSLLKHRVEEDDGENADNQ